MHQKLGRIGFGVWGRDGSHLLIYLEMAGLFLTNPIAAIGFGKSGHLRYLSNHAVDYRVCRLLHLEMARDGRDGGGGAAYLSRGIVRYLSFRLLLTIGHIGHRSAAVRRRDGLLLPPDRVFFFFREKASESRRARESKGECRREEQRE